MSNLLSTRVSGHKTRQRQREPAVGGQNWADGRCHERADAAESEEDVDEAPAGPPVAVPEGVDGLAPSCVIPSPQALAQRRLCVGLASPRRWPLWLQPSADHGRRRANRLLRTNWAGHWLRQGQRHQASQDEAELKSQLPRLRVAAKKRAVSCHEYRHGAGAGHNSAMDSGGLPPTVTDSSDWRFASVLFTAMGPYSSHTQWPT